MENSAAFSVETAENRCFDCRRMFQELKQEVEIFHPEFPVKGVVKIWLETKCGRCKGLDHKLIVIQV
jgi:hypothetical protein